MPCQRISTTQSLILRCSTSNCSRQSSRPMHSCYLHQLFIRTSNPPGTSQDKRLHPLHLLGATEAHPPQPQRLKSRLCHLILDCRSSRDHLSQSAQGGCHPQGLRLLSLLQPPYLMGKPLCHPRRRLAAALLKHAAGGLPPQSAWHRGKFFLPFPTNLCLYLPMMQGSSILFTQKGLRQCPLGHLPPSVRGNLAHALMIVHTLILASPGQFCRPLASLPGIP